MEKLSIPTPPDDAPEGIKKLFESLNAAPASVQRKAIAVLELVMMLDLFKKHDVPRSRMLDWATTFLEYENTEASLETLLNVETKASSEKDNPALKALTSSGISPYEVIIALNGANLSRKVPSVASRLNTLREGLVKDFDPSLWQDAMGVREANGKAEAKPEPKAEASPWDIAKPGSFPI